MESKTYEWNKNQPIVNEYFHNFNQLKELFEHNPWEDSSIDQRVNWLDTSNHIKADRGKLIQVLKNYNESIHNHSKVFDNISLLEDKRTLVVVGGQQAGLLTGPLLVIHKAITIIQTARRESKRIGREVVPVFWIAGEDHDYDEVNHITYLSQQLQVERIKLEPITNNRSSISQLQIDFPAWEKVLEELDSHLMDTEFKPEIVSKLRQYSEQSETLTDFFARIMAWLFGHHGLIMLDSADPDLRKVEGSMFEQIIDAQSLVNNSLLRGKDKLQSLGYEAQAEVREDGANLFIIHNGNRVLLQRGEEGFFNKKYELTYSMSELLNIANTSPEKLSNNVFTRPLMQEFLFPVLHTILGPGEIAYWSMLAETFRSIGMRMPVITPRREVTLLEGTIQKHMTKYELSFDEVVQGFDAWKKDWLSAQDKFQLELRFTEVKAQFQALYDPLLETVSEIHSGIGKLGETNKQKILEQIDFLQSRATDAFESQFEASLRQLDRIHLSILPLGKPQERVYNTFVYLNKYGTDWLEELIRTPAEDPRLHTIFYY